MNAVLCPVRLPRPPALLQKADAVNERNEAQPKPSSRASASSKATSGAAFGVAARRLTIATTVRITGQCWSAPLPQLWRGEESGQFHGAASASTRGAVGQLWGVRPRKALARRRRTVSAAVRPNHSLKLSPNGKPPGPRYSAVLHCLQRGPGVSPSVPA